MFTEIREFCERCGMPFCECADVSFAFVKNRSVFVYDDAMGDVIHAFKYGNHPAHGRALGKVMASRFSACFSDIELIVPVPMYRKKERSRGFNQANILAREIARDTGIAYDCKSLLRVRDTAAQSGLTAPARKVNLAGAFSLSGNSRAIVNKNILLVDDIMTTGSTLHECAGVLKRGGAATVYAYTLAAAVKKHS
jgi:ComF family protein